MQVKTAMYIYHILFILAICIITPSFSSSIIERKGGSDGPWEDFERKVEVRHSEDELRKSAEEGVARSETMHCTRGKSAKKCERCLETAQCKEGMFCCPRLKVCLTGGAGCRFNPTKGMPFAMCNPPCHHKNDGGKLEQKECTCTGHEDFPEKWTGDTCQVYDLSSGHSCKEKFFPITKSKDCKEAAKAIRDTFSGNITTSRPQGCYHEGESGKILFNQGSDGNYVGDDKIICKKEEEIVTVTAKIWYVSDFHGKNTRVSSEKVDPGCVDNPPDHRCERTITGYDERETIPENVRNSWDEDTPYNRAQAVVNANLDYMNWAYANSDIPIRYIQWGSVQDIGQTEAQIGSGLVAPTRTTRAVGASRSTKDVYDSMVNIFGDSEEGRLRLYQTADVVLLIINNEMTNAAGVCYDSLHEPEGSQKEYRFSVFVATYTSGWLFAHEAGHCVGGKHLRPEGYEGTRTNFAYCPPTGEYGTIEAYVWDCVPGPSGQPRGRPPYYSNPDVVYEGAATGSEIANNAKFMTDERFDTAAAGTNCLDGNPDEKWMNFDTDGTIGNNCPNGEKSYEPPLSMSAVDCTYSDWSEWEECDEKCGGGKQVRKREIATHGWYRRTKCTYQDGIETRTCNEDPCQVDYCPEEHSSCKQYAKYYPHLCDPTKPANHWFLSEGGTYSCKKSCGLC